MTDKDKIAALEARVAELEAKAKPPEEPKPFVPDPNWQRYDPTAGMSMPRSALEAMIAAEPRGFMRQCHWRGLGRAGASSWPQTFVVAGGAHRRLATSPRGVRPVRVGAQ